MITGFRRLAYDRHTGTATGVWSGDGALYRIWYSHATGKRLDNEIYRNGVLYHTGDDREFKRIADELLILTFPVVNGGTLVAVDEYWARQNMPPIKERSK